MLVRLTRIAPAPATYGVAGLARAALGERRFGVVDEVVLGEVVRVLPLGLLLLGESSCLVVVECSLVLATIDEGLVVVEREVASPQLLRRRSGLEMVSVGSGRAGSLHELHRLRRDAGDIRAGLPLMPVAALLLEPARATLSLALLRALAV